MNQDNLCKSLIESNPRPFITWLFRESVAETQINILKTELSLEPIRADFVSFLEVGDQILHLEFQTQADREMPLRMLDYYTRLYRQYRRPVQQVVLFLRSTTSPHAQMITLKPQTQSIAIESFDYGTLTRQTCYHSQLYGPLQFWQRPQILNVY